jgi:predicted branched-subunit amino acid permease
MTQEASVVFTRAGALRGMREAVPLLFGLAPFGLVTGIAAQGAGHTVWPAAC